MPDACPNGSTVAPGAPSLVYLGPALIETLFPDWSAWLGTLIPVIGLQLINTAELCATSPNASDEITAADVAEALLTPLGMLGLADKVIAAAKVQIWNTYCVCNGTAVDQWTVVASSDACIAGASEQLGPFLVPSGSHHFKLFMSIYDGGADNGWGGGAGYLGGTFVTDSGGHRVNRSDGLVEIFDVTATVDRWWLTHSAADGGANACTHLEVQMLTPAGTVIVPTPPDPQPQPSGLPDAPPAPSCADLDAVCAAIQALQQQLSVVNVGSGRVETIATDIQSVSPAKTLVMGGSAADQTGSTQHDVADIRAVLVNVTTIPAYKGHSWSDPYTYFDLGVLRIGDESGWTVDYPIDKAAFVLLDVPPSATKLSLSLAPDVVASVSWWRKGT